MEIEAYSSLYPLLTYWVTNRDMNNVVCLCITVSEMLKSSKKKKGAHPLQLDEYSSAILFLQN